MRTWHHGHSIGTGFLLAAAFLNDHTLWVISGAFLAGLLLGRSWSAVKIMLGGLDRRLFGPSSRPGMRRVW